MLAALIVGLAPHVGAGSFVFRACFRGTDYDVVMRESNEKAPSDMCIYRETCGAAEVVIRVDPSAQRSFWVSSHPEKCR